ERTNQADIRAFRSFYRAHASIVGMVDVTNFKPRPLTGKTSGTESAQSTLMRKFSQWIRLIHKLRKLRTTEKFLNCRGYRTDINQSLRCNNINILYCHSFAYYTLHSGKPYAKLVLKKLAYRAQPPASKMIDKIGRAHV